MVPLDFAKSKSLSVTIPTSLESESTTKRPEISLSSAYSNASLIDFSDEIEYGFSIITLPERFTFRTSFACS